MISVINICWETGIVWEKTIIENISLGDTINRGIILPLSYRRIIYGASGVIILGMVVYRF
ncbi:MAG: hypothetical protein ACKVH5_03440 [Fidelibacterota bacterium]